MSDTEPGKCIVMQPIEKFHHFVSQMQLKRFTDANGKMHVWNKTAAKLLYQKPAKTFGQTHLYTTEDAEGRKDTSFEKELSKIESSANMLLTKIEDAVAQGMAPTVDTREKALFDLFFYTAWKRVPDFFNTAESIKKADAFFDTIVSGLRAKYPDRLDELDALDTPQSRERLLQGGKIQGIAKVSERIVGLIASRGLIICRVPLVAPGLIIGSLPIVRTASPLTDAEGEAWLPITPRLVVGPGLAADQVTLAEFDPEKLEEINRVIASQSTMFGGPDEQQVAALRDWLQTRHR